MADKAWRLTLQLEPIVSLLDRELAMTRYTDRAHRAHNGLHVENPLP